MQKPPGEKKISLVSASRARSAKSSLVGGKGKKLNVKRSKAKQFASGAPTIFWKTVYSITTVLPTVLLF
jgi:hypothetical protein